MPLLLLALAISLKALWERRHTWNSPWDCPVTLGVLLLMLNVLISTPQVPLDPLADFLCQLTGVCNLDLMIGHILRLMGLTCILYMGVTRLKLSERGRRVILLSYIEVPAMILLPMLIGAFVWGHVHRHVHDFAAEPVTPGMIPYWTVMGGILLHISGSSIKLLRVIKQNPKAKTAHYYLIACWVTVSTVFIGSVHVLIPIPEVLWAAVRIELFVYSGAAWLSWRSRVAQLN